MTSGGRRATILAVAPWFLTLALFAGIGGLAIVATASPSFGMDISTAGFLLLTAIWALVQSSVGTAIALRRPENRIGRLMQLTGPLIVSVFVDFLSEPSATRSTDRVTCLAGWPRGGARR